MRDLEEQVRSEINAEPLELCHNDLQPENFLFDSATGKMHLIDFEYCGFNPPGFDFANVFNELCGLDVNVERFPSESLRREMLTMYVQERERC